MILHAHRCVFFHIPKTAGYAIEQALAPGNRDYHRFDPELVFGLKDGRMTQHLPYGAVLELAPQATMDSYFKFGFTRNTWDRLVSAYCYLKPQHDRAHGGFAGWVEAVCGRVRAGKVRPGDHTAPQTDYLFHEGRRVLDFTGAFENLQADFDHVCDRLGLPRQVLPRLNQSRAREGHYAGYYDDRTRGLVAETYAEEIALLNYQFEPN